LVTSGPELPRLNVPVNNRAGCSMLTRELLTSSGIMGADTAPLVTEKTLPPETPPPGPGLNTVTVIWNWFLNSVAGNIRFIVVDDTTWKQPTTIGGLAAALHLITDTPLNLTTLPFAPVINPVPVIMTVVGSTTLAATGRIDAGFKLVIVGRGLLRGVPPVGGYAGIIGAGCIGMGRVIGGAGIGVGS